MPSHRNAGPCKIKASSLSADFGFVLTIFAILNSFKPKLWLKEA